MMHPQNIQLKPQDLVVLLRLLVWDKSSPWKYGEIARDLEISQSEIHQAIKRATLCDLFDPLTRRPKRNNLKEFVLHGLRYVFPPTIGKLCKGIPTAHSIKPLSDQLVVNESQQYVWPWKKGKAQGLSMKPLYRSVPTAALKNKKLYELLALIDALRVGKARERQLAKEELSKRISIV